MKRLGDEWLIKALLAIALLIPLALINIFGKLDAVGIVATIAYGLFAVAAFKGLVYPGDWLHPSDDG